MYTHKHTHIPFHICVHTYTYMHMQIHRYTHMYNTHHMYWWKTNNSSTLTFYKELLRWPVEENTSCDFYGRILKQGSFWICTQWRHFCGMGSGLKFGCSTLHMRIPFFFISVIFSIPRKAEPLSAGLHSAAHECMCIWLWINRVR